jgi:hypothetical protein
MAGVADTTSGTPPDVDYDEAASVSVQSVVVAPADRLWVLDTDITLPSHRLDRGSENASFLDTVKTQAISVYRKLGASARSQAVQRLQEIGLLGT